MWSYTPAIILVEMITLKQRTKNWFRPISTNSATILEDSYSLRQILNPKQHTIGAISDLDPVWPHQSGFQVNRLHRKGVIYPAWKYIHT